MNKSLMIIILISSIFVFQGCVPEVNNDSKVEEKISTSSDEQLLKAALEKDTESIEKWIQEGANINAQDQSGRTAAMIATYNNDLASFQVLIEAEADPSITNRYGGTALIPASEHGYVDVVRELLTQTSVNVNHVNQLGWTALLEAIILNDGNKGQKETIQLLIDHGADVNLSDRDGVSPLIHAKNKGFKEIEEILVQAGAK
ncbi:ankyrin repeat domain-containing protein [Paenibacillus sp. FSL K6-0108]|uniref:ankyrin repeat domain-containing protein n=1 Tax=Paenibacillus sp. FSL K6-0108 TaxID=2921417 RepID=UPI003255E854